MEKFATATSGLGEEDLFWNIPKGDLPNLLAYMNRFNGLRKVLMRHKVDPNRCDAIGDTKFITIWNSTYDDWNSLATSKNSDELIRAIDSRDIAYYRLDDSLGWVEIEIMQTYKDKV